ncbi:MAG: Tex family protein [Anaerovoracaceae bacterium]|jgi:uncharacterized protein
MNISEKIAKELNLPVERVDKTIALMDEGNTIPFIARYRKEVTGNMSDVELRDLEDRLTYLRSLEERKAEVCKLIDEQGKLTDQLRQSIEEAEILQRVEDFYKPFKKKKTTRAAKAKEKGLEPLAMVFWAQEMETGSPEKLAGEYVNLSSDPALAVESPEDAIAGALDIIAEMISDDPDLTQMVREKTEAAGQIVSLAADPEEKTVYEPYYEFAEKISKIPDHRILAINRGEKEKKLKVKVEAPVEAIHEALLRQVIKNERSIFLPLLIEATLDSYKRLTAPSVEREMRNMLTERAELAAVKIFGKNTESLLMTPPVKGARVISIDPGFRTGCKVAVLDERGRLLAYTTVYPTEPRKDIKGTEATLKKLVDKYKINTIAIGNGTASRETEEVVADFIQKSGLPIHYTIVNEAGASVYSASKLATEEYPDLDVTTRGAMSLGRRLQDPMAELVKIPIKSIGVGQYQHDINQKLLEGELAKVVENCVNRVGVDLNTASPSLLEHVAGINSTIARNIVAYREEIGGYRGRTELKKVSKLGPKAFDQCAGFMRISEGKNPLDATSVHPESYKAAEAMLEKLGMDKKDIGSAGDIEEKIWELYGPKKKEEKPAARMKGLAALAELQKKEEPLKRNLSKALEALAKDLEIGVPTLKDIVEEIKKPGRDPREDAPPVIFRKDVRSLDDMEIGMEMTGTVRNVVDFGAFVDVGVKNDGLVHISQLSNRFVKHPMDVVSVGDTVKVKVLDIDKEKGKISLTMKR